MSEEVETRIDRLEEVVAGLKEVPSDFFEEDVSVDEVETCEEVKSDGEVCGREKPCPYHGDDE